MAIIRLSGCFPGFFFSESDYLYTSISLLEVYILLSLFSFSVFPPFFVLGIEPKTSHMLGKRLFFCI